MWSRRIRRREKRAATQAPTTIACTTTFPRTTDRPPLDVSLGVARGHLSTVSRLRTVLNRPFVGGAGVPVDRFWRWGEMPDAQVMTARRPLPFHLAQNAFATSRGEELGVSRSRMRASDLDTPFRGVRSAGLDLSDLVQRCRAATTFMGERDVFSHATALGLWGAPLPILDGADAALHIGTYGTGRRRRQEIVGHRLVAGTPQLLSPDGLRAVAPATARCQFASQQGELTSEAMLLALVSVADYLITGRRARGGREPAACTTEQLHAAAAAHGSARGARMLAQALPLMRVGVDSPKETELRLPLVAAGLGAPEVGHVIQTRLGAAHSGSGVPGQRSAHRVRGRSASRESARSGRGERAI